MNATCLLIDDDVEEHDLFTTALHQVNPNLNCVVLDSGIKAVEKLKSEQSLVPGFIFLDLNMPGMDGKQCLVELKTIDRLKEVPIIIYSTSINPLHVSETKELGSAGYVVKPDAFSDLVDTLNKVITTTSWDNSYFYFSKRA
ncbi:response regulator [Telluribacter sp. SYSU D00476]|uniref:response regulator n=1 Tax=Telluribacter sp. SYSU D00476 TaxID=2811430 RepID=UPI001FF103DB|nr:response regulator [Telluribacter sp. SYSU D00476]